MGSPDHKKSPVSFSVKSKERPKKLVQTEEKKEKVDEERVYISYFSQEEESEAMERRNRIELARTSISPERPETKLRRPSYLPPSNEGISESDLYDDTAQDFPGYDWFPGIGKECGWTDRDTITWEDHGVCRNFLVGPCPAQLLQNTSVRVAGECSKVHNFALQRSFRQSPRYSEYAPKFKDELARKCEKLISIADDKVQKQQSINNPLCAVCALVVDDLAHAKRREHVGYLALREFSNKYERVNRKRYERSTESSLSHAKHGPTNVS